MNKVYFVINVLAIWFNILNSQSVRLAIPVKYEKGKLFMMLEWMINVLFLYPYNWTYIHTQLRINTI